MLSLHQRRLLFNYLQAPPEAVDPTAIPSTTNALEGGINAGVKALARAHRGLSTPHQRSACDWWLYLKTEAPLDPVDIARNQAWGHDALTQAHATDTSTTPPIAGAPKTYDTAIDTTYQHSLGIQKGWLST